MERHGELALDPVVRAKLVGVSPATIDRLLAPERRRMQLKGRSPDQARLDVQNPDPIRTFADWDEAPRGSSRSTWWPTRAGRRGASTANPDGNRRGPGWFEPRALRNKAQRWVHEELEALCANLPVTMLGLDSDNGAEFINDQLPGFCQERHITFTRGRPYRKNDSCFVEQKNGTVVRQAVGYARYGTPEELPCCGSCMGRWR